VRWARHKPVVLVIPTLAGGPARTQREPRIPNVRILRIQAVGAPGEMAEDTQVQVGQILDDMARHHFERPLLWCYNWMLAGPLAQLPAVARLLHATEAHFDMPGLSSFLPRLRAAVAISDLTVAVSGGVEAGLRSRVERAEIVTVTNGCDYVLYSSGKPDAVLAALRGTNTRIAIYAGNINRRLDFNLLRRLASANPDVLFVLYGPVSALDEADKTSWKQLLRIANVMAPGPVDPDRLPDLYAATDVGLIPYRQDAWLVENGLPLKAFEMGASGLPVVSSLMKPLVGLAAGLVVTSSADDFVDAFGRTSRATLSPAGLAELKAVSSANDYDHKFEQILEALEERTPGLPVTTRVDRLIEILGLEWFASEARFSSRLTRLLPSRAPARLIRAVARRVPTKLKRRLGSNRD
jgi:glycosyltransferase involved in cell wall biosynthesis